MADLPPGWGAPSHASSAAAARTGLRVAADSLIALFDTPLLAQAGLVEARVVRKALRAAAAGEPLPLDGLADLVSLGNCGCAACWPAAARAGRARPPATGCTRGDRAAGGRWGRGPGAGLAVGSSLGRPWGVSGRCWVWGRGGTSSPSIRPCRREPLPDPNVGDGLTRHRHGPFRVHGCRPVGAVQADRGPRAQPGPGARGTARSAPTGRSRRTHPGSSRRSPQVEDGTG